MLDWQSELKDARDFMESLKIDLVVDEVFVFTPKGDVFGLPIGATPIDFAYRVHTEVGHRCAGAKVNGKIVPLDAPLNHGDIVEIITSKKDKPSLDWLSFAKTTGARIKIKHWFKEQRGLSLPKVLPTSAKKLPPPLPKKASRQIVPVEINVEAFDRVGVLKDVLAEISETGTNVSAARISTKRGSSAILRLVVDVKDTEHLARVVEAIKRVADVYNVSRK